MNSFIDRDKVEQIIFRHERIAFQFSGGRDSTAALYLLRPYWDRMTIYHVNAGDQFPETKKVVEAVRRDVDIVDILSDVLAFRENHGLASDLIPVDNQPIGQMISGRSQKIVGRYECCIANLMFPMHQRMLEDGITLIVRGQRDDEFAKPPLRSGDFSDNVQLLYPIQEWTGDQVTRYLKDNGLPLAEFYDRGSRRAPECMGCTAWWDEGRVGYLRRWHPVAFEAFQKQIKTIKQEINRQYAILDMAEKE